LSDDETVPEQDQKDKPGKLGQRIDAFLAGHRS
jgi:hypothetical protein